MCMSVFLYVYECSAWMYVHDRSGKGIRVPRTGVTDHCEPSCGCWELRIENLLQKKQTPSVEPFLYISVCSCGSVHGESEDKEGGPTTQDSLESPGKVLSMDGVGWLWGCPWVIMLTSGKKCPLWAAPLPEQTTQIVQERECEFGIGVHTLAHAEGQAGAATCFKLLAPPPPPWLEPRTMVSPFPLSSSLPRDFIIAARKERKTMYKLFELSLSTGNTILAKFARVPKTQRHRKGNKSGGSQWHQQLSRKLFESLGCDVWQITFLLM